MQALSSRDTGCATADNDDFDVTVRHCCSAFAP
jgi:hypothetical protein